MLQKNITLKLRGNNVIDPDVITAQSEAGLGYVVGCICKARLTPRELDDNGLELTLIPAIASLNQFMYGMGIALRDPTTVVDANYAHISRDGKVQVDQKGLIIRAERLAEQREAYLYFHAPPSFAANARNHSSLQYTQGANASLLAKRLENEIEADALRAKFLQEKANLLGAKINNPIAATQNGPVEMATRATLQNELNETLAALNQIQSRLGHDLKHARVAHELSGPYGAAYSLQDLDAILKIANPIMRPANGPLNVGGGGLLIHSVGGRLEDARHLLSIKDKIHIRNMLNAVAVHSRKNLFKKLRGRVPQPAWVKSALGKNINNTTSVRIPPKSIKILNSKQRKKASVGRAKKAKLITTQLGQSGTTDHWLNKPSAITTVMRELFNRDKREEQNYIYRAANKLNNAHSKEEFDMALADAGRVLDARGMQDLRGRLTAQSFEMLPVQVAAAEARRRHAELLNLPTDRDMNARPHVLPWMQEEQQPGFPLPYGVHPINYLETDRPMADPVGQVVRPAAQAAALAYNHAAKAKRKADDLLIEPMEVDRPAPRPKKQASSSSGLDNHQANLYRPRMIEDVPVDLNAVVQRKAAVRQPRKRIEQEAASNYSRVNLLPKNTHGAMLEEFPFLDDDNPASLYKGPPSASLSFKTDGKILMPRARKTVTPPPLGNFDDDDEDSVVAKPPPPSFKLKKKLPAEVRKEMRANFADVFDDSTEGGESSDSDDSIRSRSTLDKGQKNEARNVAHSVRDSHIAEVYRPPDISKRAKGDDPESIRWEYTANIPVKMHGYNGSLEQHYAPGMYNVHNPEEQELFANDPKWNKRYDTGEDDDIDFDDSASSRFYRFMADKGFTRNRKVNVERSLEEKRRDAIDFVPGDIPTSWGEPEQSMGEWRMKHYEDSPEQQHVERWTKRHFRVSTAVKRRVPKQVHFDHDDSHKKIKYAPPS